MKITVVSTDVKQVIDIGFSSLKVVSKEGLKSSL
jgi:hypothetical protein